MVHRRLRKTPMKNDKEIVKLLTTTKEVNF